MEIGFGDVDITPPLGAPMMGQLIAHPNVGVESSLHALSMALRDGERVVLFVVCDILMFSNEDADEARRRVAHKLMIDRDAIIISATHTHSGPSTMPVFGQEKNALYHEQLMTGIVQSAVEAVAGLLPACLSWGQTACPGYGFNRRFVMTDGSVETHPLLFDPLIVRPEGPDQSTLHLLAAASQDRPEVPVALAVFFGCHPTVMPRENKLISADFPGKVRDHVEAKLLLACERCTPAAAAPRALFFQAASGNICQCDPLNEHTCEVGRAL
jgi:neutral ceramidase